MTTSRLAPTDFPFDSLTPDAGAGGAARRLGPSTF